MLKLSEAQFAAEVRFLAAAKLFEIGKLSSGQAAEMAGIGRVEFLHKLGGHGVYAINLDDEQIEAELKAAAEIVTIRWLSPQFSLETARQGIPFKDPAVLECHLAALRKAGLK